MKFIVQLSNLLVLIDENQVDWIEVVNLDLAFRASKRTEYFQLTKME